MSLSVKMPGENVADLSVATGKNDTEMGSHACGLYGAELSCIKYRLTALLFLVTVIAAEGGLLGPVETS